MEEEDRMILRKIALSFFCLIFLSNSAFAEVTMERLVNAMSEPENWLTHHKSLDGARYVELNEINKYNVKN